MGDGADALTESGIEEWAAHCAGFCDIDAPCIYCSQQQDRPSRRGGKANREKADRSTRTIHCDNRHGIRTA